jgi:hypothetical protein
VGISRTSIAHHAAADPRQRTEQNGRDGTDVKRQCFFGARRDEKGETGGVEQQHRAAQLVDQGIPEEGNHARKDGDGKIAPVIDRRGRNGSDHDVARNAARVSRCEAQDKNAKEIELMLDGLGRAAEGEDEGAREVEDRQQSIGKMRIDGCDLHHADSQACAATTMATRRRLLKWD